MSFSRAQKARTRGSRERLPVERGLERSATRDMSVAARRADRQAVAVEQGDADRLDAAADIDRRLAQRRLQVEERDARIVREAAAIAPVAAAVVAVDVVADGDRIGSGVRDRDADV